VTAGAKVLVYGSPATVLSVHANGKKLGVVFDSGKATFVNASAARAV
jgi:hypothetical protein